jgi:flagellar FliL protein
MADAAPKTEEGKEEAAPKAKAAGGGVPVVPILLGFNSLIMTGVLVLLVLRPAGLGGRHEAPAHAAPAVEAADGGEAHAKEGGEKEAAAKEGEHVEKAKERVEVDKDGRAPPGPTIRLADFVVHLRDSDTDRYARISFELEVPDDKAKEAVTARMPVIRDAFLSYLSDRTSAELRGGEAMANVKSVLSSRLSEVAPGVPIRALYVTELVVQ